MARLKERKPGNPPIYDHAEIKKLILADEKYKDIAQVIGCHWSTVACIAHKMGVRRYKKKRVRT